MVRSLRVLLAISALLTAVLAQPAIAKSTLPAPSVSFARFDLSGGTRANLSYGSGVLTLASGQTQGTWTSPEQTPGFAFDELVASWNATTPDATWIQIDMVATGSGRTTKAYVMGKWTSAADPAHRTSVPAQGDADGFVAIDTFVRSKKAAPLTSYHLVVTLNGTAAASPAVRFVGAMTSAAVQKYAIPSPQAYGAAELTDVPMYSQEIHAGHFPEYDGGGEAWCSPTSTAMIVDYWHAGPTPAELAAFPATGETDGQVDFTARGVYDWNYQGAGNWPFNAAYAATRVVAQGQPSAGLPLNAFVTRLRSLNEAEQFIKAGIPLVASINGRLPGFFFGKTNGHLLTIVGFTASGDVISKDPAVPTDAEVRRIYGRADFEDVWLGGSGGIVYVIYANNMNLPPNTANVPANW